MSCIQNTISITCTQENLIGSFNISEQEYTQMCSFSADGRARFIYLILKYDEAGIFVRGYSGKKTVDRLKEANSYFGSSTDLDFKEEVIKANRLLYKFVVIGYCKNKEELGDSENAVNSYFKSQYGTQWANKHLGNGNWSTEGLIGIIKEGVCQFVNPDDLQAYLDKGWVQGGTTKGTICITDGNDFKMVKEEDLQAYLDKGWVKGSNLTGTIGITDGNDFKFVKEEELQAYLDKGWIKGSRHVKKELVNPSTGETKHVHWQEMKPWLEKGWQLTLKEIRLYDNNRRTTVTFEHPNSNSETRNKAHKRLIKLLEEGWFVGRPPKVVAKPEPLEDWNGLMDFLASL